MKRVALACIEYVYEFDTKEEAETYIRDARWSGWWFETKKPVYNDCDKWEVIVRKPYKDYTPGW